MNVDAIVARIAEIAILQFDKALGLPDPKPPSCGRNGSVLVFRVGKIPFGSRNDFGANGPDGTDKTFSKAFLMSPCLGGR